MKRQLFLLVFLAFLGTAFAQKPSTLMENPFDQVHSDAFILRGLSGQEVKIGVLDAGFESFNETFILKHILDSGKLMFARDYIPMSFSSSNPDIQKLVKEIPSEEIPVYPVYKPINPDMDDTAALFNMGNTHGTEVIRLIAGVWRMKGQAAPGRDAFFYVGKTEFGKKDHRIEEFLLDTALADLWHRGVRLVNLSVGYRDNFAIDANDYTKQTMDGRTAVSSRICDKWAKKGMILVVAAGNSGYKEWDCISAPGEAAGVITVGSVESENSLEKASYSSIGSPDYGYVKPDVVCVSQSGTSLSAPVITGMIAAMLQKDPSLSPEQVRNLLHKSSALWAVPNDYVGYGIPDSRMILRLMDGDTTRLLKPRIIECSENILELEIEAEDSFLCFDKRDAFHVIEQYRPERRKGLVILRKDTDVVRTTLVTDMKNVVEVIWTSPK